MTLNEGKKICVGLQRTCVSKSTVVLMNWNLDEQGDLHLTVKASQLFALNGNRISVVEHLFIVNICDYSAAPNFFLNLVDRREKQKS